MPLQRVLPTTVFSPLLFYLKQLRSQHERALAAADLELICVSSQLRPSSCHQTHIQAIESSLVTVTGQHHQPAPSRPSPSSAAAAAAQLPRASLQHTARTAQHLHVHHQHVVRLRRQQVQALRPPDTHLGRRGPAEPRGRARRAAQLQPDGRRDAQKPGPRRHRVVHRGGRRARGGAGPGEQLSGDAGLAGGAARQGRLVGWLVGRVCTGRLQAVLARQSTATPQAAAAAAPPPPPPEAAAVLVRPCQLHQPTAPIPSRPPRRSSQSC
jgi:hypothetical protein